MHLTMSNDNFNYHYHSASTISQWNWLQHCHQCQKEKWGIGLWIKRWATKFCLIFWHASTHLTMSDVFSTLGHFGNLRGEQVTSAASQGVDQFAQVFTHRPCFAKSHPVSSKSSTGEALKICCREFEVPERLISDGSKQQTGNNSQFKKTATHCNVIHNVIEPNMHNHNPVEGAIRNIRKDWHRVMIQKQVLRDLWDHNMNWVTGIIS